MGRASEGDLEVAARVGMCSDVIPCLEQTAKFITRSRDTDDLVGLGVVQQSRRNLGACWNSLSAMRMGHNKRQLTISLTHEQGIK